MNLAFARIEAPMPTPSLPPQPTVCVVDDDVSVRESVEALVTSLGFAVETFVSAEHFLRATRRAGPTCLVLDVTLPELNGLDLQQRLAADGKRMPIIFVTGYGDVPMSVRAMKAGAVEFLTKPFVDAVLVDAIRSAIELSRSTLVREAETRGLQARYDALTRREREVMALVVEGRLNKQIAAEIGISEITVKAHRGQVMRKMRVRTLPDLVKIAAKLRDTAAG